MTAPYSSLGVTHSSCETCGNLVPAKVVTDGRDVYFLKFCAVHGETKTLVREGVEEYLYAQRYVKPAWMPREFSGDSDRPCPHGCGFCDRHEQHLCMPIVEVTNRCNLACPVCLNTSGTHTDESRPWNLEVREFRHMLDTLLTAEPQVDVLNLSGGEPLVHPAILDLIDMALERREIVRVSVSTNGLELLRHPELIGELKVRDVVVSFQYDGQSDRVDTVLRGRSLVEEKRAILQALCDADITTSLTMTVARGVNEDQFPHLLDLLFGQENIVSLMIQPIAFTGRAVGLQNVAHAISIPEVVRLLGNAGRVGVKAADFVPLPCSHPLCFSLAFYLVLDEGGTVSLSEITDASTLLDSVANRVFFGLDSDEYVKLKEMIYKLWSGPTGLVPEGKNVLATLRTLLKRLQTTSSAGRFDPRSVFTVAERKIKSIFIHAFQDAQTFDLARVRRCCQAYVQPDASLVPVCVNNVLRRGRTHTSE